MKLSILATAAVLSSSFVAADDVSKILSDNLVTVPTLAPGAATTLASAIASITSSFGARPDFSSIISDIVEAIPTESSALNFFQTAAYTQITAQPWWTSVPAAAQSAFNAEQSALASAIKKAESGALAARPRGVGAVMGAVAAGVLGAMLVL